MNRESILETKRLTMHFGGLTAVRDFSAAIPKGTISGLIGPNGAGKTTCFNMISGFYAPSSGQISFNDTDITGMPPYNVCRTGLARTFQNIRLFGNGTVLQNVMVGCYVRQKSAWWHSLIWLPSSLREERAIAERSRDLLRVVGLAHLADEKARSLPYGAQRRLEIARALATEPQFLLLDEPAAGMNEQESDDLLTAIRRVQAERGCGILIVDHDLRLMMRLCERIHVLAEGRTIAEGTPEDVRGSQAVIAAYLGSETHHGEHSPDARSDGHAKEGTQ
jgi:branched-chain amino acid transport system ATP-binding protein